jgi:nucleotide-binding universal stress UspA family protein
MPRFTEMRGPTLWDEPRPHRRPSLDGTAVALARPPRTVVLGYDGSAAALCALTRAAEAAGRGGRVLVITAVPRADAPELEREMDFIGEPEDLLVEAEALLRSHNIEASTRLMQGEPAEALVRAASESDADLIVVGARGRSYLARVFRGSVAERLAVRAPCDVLIARSVPTGRPRGAGRSRRWSAISRQSHPSFSAYSLRRSS